MPKTYDERDVLLPDKITLSLADSLESEIEKSLDKIWDGTKATIEFDDLPSKSVQRELEKRYGEAGFRLGWQPPSQQDQQAYIHILKG